MSKPVRLGFLALLPCLLSCSQFSASGGSAALDRCGVTHGHWVMIAGGTETDPAWTVLQQKQVCARREIESVPIGVACSGIVDSLGIDAIVVAPDVAGRIRPSDRIERRGMEGDAIDLLRSVLRRIDRAGGNEQPVCAVRLSLPVGDFCRFDRKTIYVAPTNCVLEISTLPELQERRRVLISLCERLGYSLGDVDFPRSATDEDICSYVQQNIFAAHGIEVSNVAVDPILQWVQFDSSCEDLGLVAEGVLSGPLGQHPFDPDISINLCTEDPRLDRYKWRELDKQK